MKRIATRFILSGIMLSALTVLFQHCSDPETKIRAEADAIHAAALTLDTHCDLPMLMHSRPDFDLAEAHDPHTSGSKVDFPRIKKGGMDAMFFAVYLGQGPRTPEGYADAKRRALELFDIVHGIANDHPDIAGLATTPEDAVALKRAGKFSVFTAVENGWAIGKDLSLLETYYELGARYMTLCHTSNNDICDSSTDSVEHGGLSPFGIDVVREMNRLGMIVDVSHISDDAFWDCIEYSAAPIVATHSSARALYDHPRNLSDEMISALAQKGGVVQMNMLSGYLKDRNPERAEALQALRAKYPRGVELTEEQRAERAAALKEIDERYPEELATLQQVVDHIDHIVKLVGVDHVGIGPDLDGGGGVEGMFDVSEMGNITYELVKRGYSEDDIKKIWSGNFFRVMKEAQRVAAEWSS
ncbi:dipeptidase [Parapedobacter deserti]|uniref:Dipeptidase n=1 Tax=Parapedobacter deserti TaxID=1912957 RepID=A0ABV7JJV7_9SPHI